LYDRNAQTAKKIHDLFNQRKLFKQYLAITKNIPNTNDGIIDIPLIRREINGIVKVSFFFVKFINNLV
jgi:23S rRNA-/tRNA-specific pseudouridylate synthase